MISTALPYKAVFERAKKVEKLYDCLPSDGLLLRLELFFEIIELSSGTDYVCLPAHTHRLALTRPCTKGRTARTIPPPQAPTDQHRCVPSLLCCRLDQSNKNGKYIGETCPLNFSRAMESKSCQLIFLVGHGNFHRFYFILDFCAPLGLNRVQMVLSHRGHKSLAFACYFFPTKIQQATRQHLAEVELATASRTRRLGESGNG
jgi:hypothetical protein